MTIEPLTRLDRQGKLRGRTGQMAQEAEKRPARVAFSAAC
jgi:hypothetical protein